ncbi:hypothetical protein [Solirubrobacter soli]|uniref:hypothetical protein n=1 Tax=Solirubrobacter soli TaxID=363832 RepID=UPI0004157CC4|nr:hypothetical protein [Solirubrobacter soli]
MQDALPIVIVAVVVVAGLVGVAALGLSRAPYDNIGRSDLTLDSRVNEDSSRDEEIAQMLTALGRPHTTPRDPALEAEVRAAIEARNRRLIARGKPPLDVEGEVERRLFSQDG